MGEEMQGRKSPVLRTRLRRFRRLAEGRQGPIARGLFEV